MIYLIVTSITLAMALIRWWFLILSAMISVAYNLLCRSDSKKRDHELLAFAKEFREMSRGEGLNAALAGSLKSDSAPKELRELSKKMMLGQISLGDSRLCEDKNTRELMEIIEISVQNGTDIKNNLNLFISRLESDMENSNQSMQNSLNMNTLSSFGVSFFVPMFGGIGSSIISGSGAILGTASVPVIPFQTVIVIYVAIMSYVMCAFKPGNGQSPLLRSFQATIMGAGIIKVSAAFMAYAI
jgi:hypothetical protein